MSEEPAPTATPDASATTKSRILQDHKKTGVMLQNATFTRDPNKRLALLHDVIALLNPLADESPGNSMLQLQLGVAYFALFNFDNPERDKESLLITALQHLEKARTLSENLDDSKESVWVKTEATMKLARTYEALGSLNFESDKTKAKSYYDQYRKTLKAMADEGAYQGKLTPLIAVATLKYADTCWYLGEEKEADLLYEAEWQRIIGSMPAEQDALTEPAAVLFTAYHAIGAACLKKGQSAEALAKFKRALQLLHYWEKQCKELRNANRVMTMDYKMHLHIYLATACILEGDYSAADSYLQSVEVLPTNTRKPLSSSASSDGVKITAASLENIRKAIAILKDNDARRPGQTLVRAEAFQQLGMSLIESEPSEAAYAFLKRAKIAYENNAASGGQSERKKLFLFLGDFVTGAVSVRELDEALDSLSIAIKLGESLLLENPGDEAITSQLAQYKRRLKIISRM